MKQRHPDVYRYRGWRAYAQLIGTSVTAALILLLLAEMTALDRVWYAVAAMYCGAMALYELNKIRFGYVRLNIDGFELVRPLRGHVFVPYSSIRQVEVDVDKGTCTIK